MDILADYNGIDFKDKEDHLGIVIRGKTNVYMIIKKEADQDNLTIKGEDNRNSSKKDTVDQYDSDIKKVADHNVNMIITENNVSKYCVKKKEINYINCIEENADFVNPDFRSVGGNSDGIILKDEELYFLDKNERNIVFNDSVNEADETSREILLSSKSVNRNCKTKVHLEMVVRGGRLKLNENTFNKFEFQGVENISINKSKYESLGGYQNSSQPTISETNVLKRSPLKGQNHFKCSECDYSTSRQSNLSNHIRTHTGEKPFKCNDCNYNCSQKSNLDVHLKSHTGLKRFKCSDCDFCTLRKGNLNAHMRIHTGEKHFKCNMCDYIASRKSHLDVHKRTHTGEKPFKCSLCDYGAAVNSHLKNHMRSHTGEKPFKCSDCDYSAAIKSHLKDHIKTHTGEKPFKCTYCDYCTSRKSHLKTHIRMHTGEKPFKCNYCDYNASQKGTLIAHIRTHTGGKSYESSSWL